MRRVDHLQRDDVRRPRERSAFLAAPLIATIVWYVVTLLHLAVVNGRLRWGPDIVAMAIGAATWGLVVACGATVLLAVPLYLAVRRTSGLSFATTIVGGTGVGLALSVAVLLVTGEWGVLFSPVHGVVVGFATAALWWHLAGKPGDRRRPSS